MLTNVKTLGFWVLLSNLNLLVAKPRKSDSVKLVPGVNISTMTQIENTLL